MQLKSTVARSYIHTASDGAETRVYVDTDGTRWHYIGDTQRRMILPNMPTTAAGRYFYDAIASGEYSAQRLHDDYMLEGPAPVMTLDDAIKADASGLLDGTCAACGRAL